MISVNAKITRENFLSVTSKKTKHKGIWRYKKKYTSFLAEMLIIDFEKNDHLKM